MAVLCLLGMSMIEQLIRTLPPTHVSGLALNLYIRAGTPVSLVTGLYVYNPALGSLI